MSPTRTLHPGGQAVLEARGWRRVGPDDTSATPLLALTTCNAADFATGVRGAGVPRVSQLPQALTALLDDKARRRPGPANSNFPTSLPGPRWASDTAAAPPTPRGAAWALLTMPRSASSTIRCCCSG